MRPPDRHSRRAATSWSSRRTPAAWSTTTTRGGSPSPRRAGSGPCATRCTSPTLKAKDLKSRLEWAAQRLKLDKLRIPRVEPAVFLSDPGLRSRLDEVQSVRVYGRDEAAVGVPWIWRDLLAKPPQREHQRVAPAFSRVLPRSDDRRSASRRRSPTCASATTGRSPRSCSTPVRCGRTGPPSGATSSTRRDGCGSTSPSSRRATTSGARSSGRPAASTRSCRASPTAGSRRRCRFATTTAARRSCSTTTRRTSGWTPTSRCTGNG